MQCSKELKPHIRWYGLLQTWQCMYAIPAARGPVTLYAGTGDTPTAAYRQCMYLKDERTKGLVTT